MSKQEHASQVSSGVFLIGLALLFITRWWWPGIMFVIAASMIAKSMAMGRSITSATGAFWMIGIGLLFAIPDLFGSIFDGIGNLWQYWPLILIAIGLFMLFGGKRRPRVDNYDDKLKHDDEYYSDEME